MSVNRYLPHLHVIPEDDANRQLANGFQEHHNVDHRQIQVLPEAGGRYAVLDFFDENHAASMRRFPEGQCLLLMDFDEDTDLIELVRSRIPRDLWDRVFVLGVRPEPEDLRTKLSMRLEDIGTALAQECSDGNDEIWSDELLGYNAVELKRLRTTVAPFLFRAG